MTEISKQLEQILDVMMDIRKELASAKRDLGLNIEGGTDYVLTHRIPDDTEFKELEQRVEQYFQCGQKNEPGGRLILDLMRALRNR
jgi:hypothetical protein